MREPDAKFEPIQLKGNSRWCVRITLPHGVQSHISYFKTEAEARTWIGENSDVWLTDVQKRIHLGCAALWPVNGPPMLIDDPLARLNAYRRSQTTNGPILSGLARSSSVACGLWPFADRAYNPSLRLLAEGSATPC